MKTNYEKLYLIQPQIYYKVLPLLNEIDKRYVKEINEDYNMNNYHSEETEENPEIVDSSIIQNHSDDIKQWPAISEVSPQTTSPKESLPFNISATNSLSGPEMPKYEVPAKRNPLINASNTEVSPQASSPKESLPDDVPAINSLSDSEIPKHEVHDERNPLMIASNKDTNLEESPIENLQSSAFKIKPKRFICEICINRGFTTKFSLRRHNNQFHRSNRNTIKAKIVPDTLPTSEPMPETIIKTQKRPREESLENDEIQNIQESKKLKTRGLKRWIDSDSTEHEQHLPRKSARIQSYKRKSQWAEKPPKRVAIQKGQGLSNWVSF